MHFGQCRMALKFELQNHVAVHGTPNTYINNSLKEEASKQMIRMKSGFILLKCCPEKKLQTIY